ncbi:caskin-2-like isoform X3 [Mya arenaria]|uniref:caskin-2-like isoform X3 n=1 Tax=Mya arenaria TaxID=6604 RepID=UPI0022E6C72C|nr:caskin-2-like isoform X3 [Mya arenaria]
MGKELDLILAVRNQDLHLITKLLQKNYKSSSKLRPRGSSKKVNVNYQDGDGMSGLHQAALMGHTEIMQLLLRNGANVNLKDNKGMIALHYAAWQGKLEPVHVLLEWRSHTNEPAAAGETPLHLAAQHGHFDVVNLLLLHQASPLAPNKDRKTPLHLACEFGRYRVVDLLLRSNLCCPLLVDSCSDLAENRPTCLHLAAKNGHSDIIRLLLQGGMNVNRSTPQGTCLHEAALFGKTDVVRLLLDCGVDVNKVNSYDQTALDIVNKFTANRASREIKEILKEASFCVQAKAVRDYCNIANPATLTFRNGDLIKIVEQRQDGMWRGSLVRDGGSGQTGWFPADHVVLIDTDEVGADLMSMPPPPPPSYQNYVNNNTPQAVVNGKMQVNHVGDHLYVDNVEPAYQNSWDARSASPAGSNRNSSASTDSGRGLSTNYLDPKGHHNYVNVHVSNQYRLSGTSYESGVSSRQSYHSTSSSSVGSLDRLEESGYSSQVNVAELFQAGLPDHEVLRAWLRDLNYEEYYQNFMSAGYDMATITHMTPQDLTAIGISKPGHRKKLKAEIARLNINDGIPDFKPNDLHDWLRMLNLEQYYSTLANQGYDNIDYVTDITWEDLEEIGIQRLGHQKKIMLAIDRLKRIVSVSKRLSTMDGTNRDSVEVLEPAVACVRWSGERSSPPPPAPPQYNELPPYLKPRRSSSGDSLSTNSSGEMKSMNQPLESEYANTSSLQSKAPAVVPIQVKRSMSQSTPNSVSEREPGSHPKMCQSFHMPPDRTSDYSDRENTPTGDDMNIVSPASGVAVAPLVAAKPKPVAMIVAKCKHSSREGSPDIIDIEKHEAEKNLDGYKSPVQNLEGFKYPLSTGNGSLKRRTSDNIYDVPQLGPPRTVQNYVNYPPMSMSGALPMSGHQVQPRIGSPLHVTTGFNYPQQAGSPRASQQNSPGGRAKKAPPPPPKRTASIKSMETVNKNMGGVNQGLSTMSSSGAMTSVLSPPPIQQKPQIAQAQSQAFVNCVQSLSERFGKKSEDTGDGVCSDGEDMASAPPVAMEIIEPKISNYGLLGKNDKATSGEYMLQQRLKRESTSSANSGNNSVESAFGVKLRQAQSESQSQTHADENSNFSSQPNQPDKGLPQESVQNNGISSQSAQNCVQISNPNTDSGFTKTRPSDEPETHRKDSTGSGRSVDLSASTSSLDSNTLPFANENVGTIKQRAQQAKPSLVMFMEHGDVSQDGESLERGDTVFVDNTDTMKRAPCKVPKPQQPSVQQLQGQQPPVMPKPQTYQQSASAIGAHTAVSPQQPQAPGSPPSSISRVGPGSPPPQQHYNASVTASYVPTAQSSLQNKGMVKPACPQKPRPKPAVSPKPQPKLAGSTPGAQKGSGKKSGDVLSEIDTMLQGLTDELDAMLEFDIPE